MSILPKVVRDPRFRAGRTLVQTHGQAPAAVELFATLLQEAIRTYGEDSLETAPAYYEYGNALLRASNYKQEQEQQVDTREAAAAAAERRMKLETTNDDEANDETTTPPLDDTKPPAKVSSLNADVAVKGEDANDEADSQTDEDDDVQLSLEMMETAFSIIDNYVDNTSDDNATREYLDWAKDQLPRVLTGIGDVLSAKNRHADATDAYLRALAHRQEALQRFAGNDNISLEHLQCRRKVVEANILIAEELLACPPDADVVTTESKDVLVRAAERVEYARGYYDKARDELQEAVFIMGQIAAKGIDLGQEKEDVCFVATLVMGVGTALAQLDEEALANQEKEPSKKKIKKS